MIEAKNSGNQDLTTLAQQPNEVLKDLFSKRLSSALLSVELSKNHQLEDPSWQELAQRAAFSSYLDLVDMGEENLARDIVGLFTPTYRMEDLD